MFERVKDKKSRRFTIPPVLQEEDEPEGVVMRRKTHSSGIGIDNFTQTSRLDLNELKSQCTAVEYLLEVQSRKLELINLNLEDKLHVPGLNQAYHQIDVVYSDILKTLDKIQELKEVHIKFLNVLYMEVVLFLEA